MEKQEIRKTCISPKENFCPLFSKIINKFTFIREYVTDKYEEPNEKKIIYKDDTYRLSITGPEEYINLFQNIYAVHDKSTLNKYLICFTMYKSYTDYCIYGMFLYFDINDISKIAEKIIKNIVLCDFDGRNQRINEKNTILYRQTLLFHQEHRDTRKITFFIKHLTYDDDIHEQIKLYFDEIYLVKGQPELTPRLLNLTNEVQDKHILFDLGSLCYEDDNIIPCTHYDLSEEKLCITKYTFTKESNEEMDNFIKWGINDVEQEDYSSSYPDYCIKCSVLTNIVSYGYNHYHINLGESYCHNCEIRYSASEGVWKCCKLTNNGWICGLTLDEKYNCSKDHNQELVVTKYLIHGRPKEKRHFKPPYKQDMQLTAVPKPKDECSKPKDDCV